MAEAIESVNVIVLSHTEAVRDQIVDTKPMDYAWFFPIETSADDTEVREF